MNRIIRNESETLHTNLISWFEQSSYEDVKKETEKGFKFKFTIPIKGIPVPFDFGGSDSEEKFNELKGHISRKEVQEMSMSRTVEFLQENISPDIVRAWEQTMARVLTHCSAVFFPDNPGPNDRTDQPDRNDPTGSPVVVKPIYGLQYTMTNEGDLTTIKVYYLPTGANDSYPTVESFRIIGGEVISGQLEVGKVISDEKTITVRQVSNGDAILLIATDKQDLDIHFTTNVLDALFLRVFIHALDITPYSHVYKKELPKGYKIIGGGYNIGFGRGQFGQTSCIPTSSYPSSRNTWTVKFSSKIDENTSDHKQRLYLSLITVYDPHDQWDIKIFNKTVRREDGLTCSPEPDYLLVGGGVELKIIGGEYSSEQLNKEDYRTGLIANFPKDQSTWEIKLNGTDLERLGSWDLTGYCIGIKKNGSIENYVKKQEHSTQVNLTDRIFFPSAGGVEINNSEDRNTYIMTSITALNTNGTPTDTSIPLGWVGFPKMGNTAIDTSVSIIGVRHSDIEVLPMINDPDIPVGGGPMPIR
ncbi:hypothetical protein [Paenibacillus pseudetheri]|nr:hypothetical protein [Paenibacillus pseudetheri]